MATSFWQDAWQINLSQMRKDKSKSAKCELVFNGFPPTTGAVHVGLMMRFTLNGDLLFGFIKWCLAAN